MTPSTRPTWVELGVELVVLALLAAIPVWTLGWWTALPFAAALGGILGGRWLRWYWAPGLGFAAGALVWGIELALLPATPRSRLADVLGPAEGLSGTAFLLIGPVLFGLVSALAALAVAGAIRLVGAFRKGPASPEPAPPQSAGPSA